MCGIAGFAFAEQPIEEKRQSVSDMLVALSHRGPDELGAYVDEITTLGNARLSIIDLINGSQPISRENGRYWIVYNGELFNYIELRDELKRAGVEFKTESDTDVVLASVIHYGEAALKKFNGQFAFAVYDRREESLLLARDLFGERPLFYHEAGGGVFSFASEMKALFKLPWVEAKLCAHGIGEIAELWTNIPGNTCFAGIKQLPPGSFARVNRHGMTFQRYAGFNFLSGSCDSVDTVRPALEQSVKLRMRSDVEVGTYLSGGLDSTITTALAIQNTSRKVRSFSVGFEDAEYDERKEQEEASKFLGTEHHCVLIGKDDIAQLFPDVVYHAESALFRTAPAPLLKLSRAVRDSGIKLVLTGEGADELFLGYNLFKETRFRENWNLFKDDSERVDQIVALYPYLKHFRRASATLQLGFYKQFLSPGPLFSHEPRFSLSHMASRLLSGKSTDNRERLIEHLNATYDGFSSMSPIEKAQALEFSTLLTGYLLSSQGDRMSMAGSVEGRCPFLDPEVASLALSLPEQARLGTDLNEKKVLKEQFASLLPRNVVERPKQPYRATMSAAFIHSKQEWVNDLLSEKSIGDCDLFDSGLTLSFVRKMRECKPERISPRDDQAFVFLLSVLLLKATFEDKLTAFQKSVPKREVRFYGPVVG